MPNPKDYYAVLGVAPTATADEIKKQYRRLAKQHHPDTNASDPKAAERFKEISEAYGVVGEAEKRTQYDEMRRLGAYGSFGGAARRPGPQNGGAGAPGANGNFRFDDADIGGFGAFSDLFSSLFNGGAPGSGPRTRAPEPGPTVETMLKVPFRTAATGGKIEVSVDISEDCAKCSGSGAAPGSRLTICTECSGRGTISFGQGGFAVNRPCPACLGRGQIPSQKCTNCHGSGEVRTKRRVAITVPPGAETGTKVRLKGQGGRGENGGPTGDLVIAFEVEADRFYEREGLDLIAKVPINIAQATLGTTINVKTIDGKKVALKIPAGTPSGKRFKVRAQGIHKDARQGDLLVEVQVTVPEKLTPEEERLMKEFAAAGGLKY